MKYKHIIWDWNGTLLDDVDQCIAVVNELLKQRDLPLLTKQRYHELFDFPAIDFYRRLGMDFTSESYENLARDYMELYAALVARCQLQAGAEKSLQTLKSAGVTHSVLSAYHQQRLDEAVDHFTLRKWFIRVVGLNDFYAHSKLENGKQWVKELEYQPRHILLLGDTLHDYEVAGAMGVDCALLSCGHQPQSRLELSGAPVFDSLKEIVDWLMDAD